MTGDERQKLRRIRAGVAALEGAEWLRVVDGPVTRLQARGGPRILLFEPAASFDEIEMVAGALDNVRFLLGLLDRALVKFSVAASAAPAVHGPDGHAEGQKEHPCVAGQGSSRTASPRTLDPAEPRSKTNKNFSTEAAMKCGEPAFKRYLAECHGLESPLTDERCAARLRHVLAIGSRADLNTDPAAAERWKDLRGDFHAWRRR